MSNQGSVDWNHYGEYSPRNDRMAQYWLIPVVEYLSNQHEIMSSASEIRILDYGCSHFHLGMSIDAHIDGYDPDQNAIDFSRKRMAKFVERNVMLTSVLEDIPLYKYDLVIANSVIQYFSDISELEEFLANCAGKWLNGRGASLLITDVIPHSYNKYLDALENIVESIKGKFLIPMMSHLLMVTLRPAKLKLMKYDPSEILIAGSRSGFQGQVLQLNLSPSKRRYSLILTKE